MDSACPAGSVAIGRSFRTNSGLGTVGQAFGVDAQTAGGWTVSFSPNLGGRPNAIYTLTAIGATLVS